MNQQLIDYIKKMREAGYGDDDIKSLLLNAGHKEEDINAAFDAADGKNVMPPPPAPLPPSPSFPPPSPSHNYQNGVSGAIEQSVSFPGVGELLSDAFRLYKSRFWTIISLSLISVLISLAYTLILPISAAFIPSSLILVVVLVLLLIPMIFILIKSVVALIFAVSAPQPVGFFEAFRASKGKVLSFFWVGLLMSFVMMGGFVMLVVPGFIFLAWFSLSQFTFVVEGHKGFNALLRSKEYVTGNWWKVFLRLLFIIIVSVLISLAIEFGMGLVSKTAASFTSYLFSALFTPLWFAYLFSLYKALRARRPELASQPVSGGKGIFVFSAILGPIALIGLPMIFTLLLLNPSGMLAESRDAQRINDLSTLTTAISLLQATTDEKLSCVPGKIYKSTDGTRAVDGTGWLPVNFNKISGGSPIGMLSMDPSDDSKYFYSYACNPVKNEYEFNANFESEKYLKGKVATDGGDNPDVYETGTDLNLIK